MLKKLSKDFPLTRLEIMLERKLLSLALYRRHIIFFIVIFLLLHAYVVVQA